MANLRSAIDYAFWDLDIASTRNLDGRAKAVPGEPYPVDGARASQSHRARQLSLLSHGFPLGLIPSVSPVPSHTELGSFALESLLAKLRFNYGWLGIVGQLRPKKLVSSIKSDMAAIGQRKLSTFQDMAKHVLDKSLFSIGLFSCIAVSSSSALTINSEAHGDGKGRKGKLIYNHELFNHDLKLEAAWPEVFIDNKGQYWNVPNLISLDLAPSESKSGLSYRFGIRKSSGHPQASNATDANAPASLMPGFSVKVAVTYEKNKEFWRKKETREDCIEVTKDDVRYWDAYDERMKEPHSTLSTVIGGVCGAWFGKKDNMLDSELKMPRPFSADIFGSMCYTLQCGKFRRLFKDLTRIDARLDLQSSPEFAEKISYRFRGSSDISLQDCLSPPTFSLILQQQVIGPIVFRMDTKWALDNGTAGKRFGRVEDFMYSLNYSLRALGSGKVVAWYSPKRKEGMVELRLYEF